MRIALVVLTTFLMALMAPSATAQDSNEVGDCLAEGQVWLLVVDDTQSVIANQCVGNPASGDDALAAAGVDVTRDSSGFICALGGTPAECPETFTGQYWNYNHAQAGEQWSYYEVGSGDSQPAGGSIEGWCYNAEGTESCFPPLLQIVQDGQTVLPAGVSQDEVVDLEVTGQGDAAQDQDDPADEGGISPVVIGVGIAVLVAVVVAWLVVRGRRTGDGVTGGR